MATHPLIVALLLGISGCAAAPGAAGTLEGTHWSLLPAASGALAARGAGGAVTLSFAAGRVSGYTGCNRYSGAYTQSGTKLEIGSISQTKRGCDGAPGELERAFLARLAGPLQLERGSGQLRLRDAAGNELRFEPGVAEASPP